MKKVAKLVIIDKDDQYLLMYRSDHPIFGTDPDIPGGVVEKGETLEEAVIREVEEETGLKIENVELVHEDNKYSLRGTYKSLFIAHVGERPEVTMSWEHSSFEWIPKNEFLEKSKHAKDRYMHLVHDVLQKQTV